VSWLCYVGFEGERKFFNLERLSLEIELAVMVVRRHCVFLCVKLRMEKDWCADRFLAFFQGVTVIFELKNYLN
jgi:hypothetical protein